MAQDKSPAWGERHQAAVLLPPAPPSDLQRSVGPFTNKCPSAVLPTVLPKSAASASRDFLPLIAGHGWLSRQVSSISRAAMPARRTLGPSSHHIGPSPSHSRTGVHSNVCPSGTTGTAAARAKIAAASIIHTQCRRYPDPNEAHSPAPRAAPGQPPQPAPLCSSGRPRSVGSEEAVAIGAWVEGCCLRGDSDIHPSFGCCGSLRH